MKRSLQGYYISGSTLGEKVNAFVPAPLPPVPPIDWSPELLGAFDRASLALGRLDSASTMLPGTALFLYMYVRKEAVLSSMIEGTQSSLSDLWPVPPIFLSIDDLSNFQVPGRHCSSCQVGDTCACLVFRPNRQGHKLLPLPQVGPGTSFQVHGRLCVHKKTCPLSFGGGYC